MRLRALFTLLLAIPLLAACGSSSPSADHTLVLVTHDSWALPKKLIAQFEQESGLTLEVVANGDAGQLTNKLVLTAGDPLGDVSFGVDNTFLGRATSAGVYDGSPTAVDHSEVCVDYDKAWFAAHHLAPPTSLADLTEPRYKDLMVTEGASTSSPGMAFLLATIAYADRVKGLDYSWQTYWKALLANGLQVDDSWDQAFDVDFTQGGGHGDRPIVVSYDSDPAYAIEHGRSLIGVVPDTCFGEIEYAGVLAGAANPKGAREFVHWLLSPAVQRALPGSMYVYPVVKGTPLPGSWAKFAVQPAHVLTVPSAEIDENRDEWLQQWTSITQ